MKGNIKTSYLYRICAFPDGASSVSAEPPSVPADPIPIPLATLSSSSTSLQNGDGGAILLSQAVIPAEAHSLANPALDTDNTHPAPT